MIGRVWTSNSRRSCVTSGESSQNKDYIQKGPAAFGSVAALKPGPAGTLSHEHKQPLILDKTARVTPQRMRMLGGLLERKVTRDNLEWAAAMASLTVSEKVKIMPSIRQHKDNERDCRTIVQQLVSSRPPRNFNKYFIQTERTGERQTKENR